MCSSDLHQLRRGVHEQADTHAQRLRFGNQGPQALGIRVSLFMDPIAALMAPARACGADRVELYTEAYASAYGTPAQAAVLARYTLAAQAATAVGLEINAGHDLNRDNLTTFLRAVPGVLEVSIGHALIADALQLGISETVRDYQRCIQAAFAASAAAETAALTPTR